MENIINLSRVKSCYCDLEFKNCNTIKNQILLAIILFISYEVGYFLFLSYLLKFKTSQNWLVIKLHKHALHWIFGCIYLNKEITQMQNALNIKIHGILSSKLIIRKWQKCNLVHTLTHLTNTLMFLHRMGILKNFSKKFSWFPWFVVWE